MFIFFSSKTAWHFEQKTKKQGTAYDYFKQSVTDPSLLDTLGLDEETKQVSHFVLCFGSGFGPD
jgi:hypothetical protein